MNELMYLLHKYSATRIEMADNILDMDYFKNLLPELAVRRPGIDLFCAVRSSLDKDQVRMLRDANFRVIIPGIESLSSRILTLMRKGVSQLQNVQLLKWCKEFGLLPRWNLLWGFPLEPAEEYDRMARLIPLLVHLYPPESFGYVSLDRFSPNFEYAEHFGFKDVSPSPAYHRIYPFEPEVVANLAYFFTYQYESGQNVEEYTRPVVKACKAWKKHFSSSDLFFVDQRKKLFIWDQRPIASEPLTILSGLQRALYIACDSAQSISRLVKIAESYHGKESSKERIEQILQSLMDKHLMIKDADSYLSLAIPVGDYVPKRAAFERFQRLLDRIEINKQHETLTKKIKIKEVSKDFRVSKEEIACSSGYARSIGNQSICS
jgi:ribosomal peptide maturation radical SAM protein 1